MWAFSSIQVLWDQAQNLDLVTMFSGVVQVHAVFIAELRPVGAIHNHSACWQDPATSAYWLLNSVTASYCLQRSNYLDWANIAPSSKDKHVFCFMFETKTFPFPFFFFPQDFAICLLWARIFRYFAFIILHCHEEEYPSEVSGSFTKPCIVIADVCAALRGNEGAYCWCSHCSWKY